MTPELRCLKDADSLDRVRFGTLDLGFLRTTYALALVPFAHALFAATGRSAPTAGWTEVRAAARDLGFWSDDARVSDPAEGSRNGRCRAC
jgi:uncharacterized protein